jgi:hypothetical protein
LTGILKINQENQKQFIIKSILKYGDSELWRMRYNHFRPHTSLKNKVPDDIYNDFKLLF